MRATVVVPVLAEQGRRRLALNAGLRCRAPGGRSQRRSRDEKAPKVHAEMSTYAPEEIGKMPKAADRDRNGHLWYFALSRLRRGEIAGVAVVRRRHRRKNHQDRAQPGPGRCGCRRRE